MLRNLTRTIHAMFMHFVELEVGPIPSAFFEQANNLAVEKPDGAHIVGNLSGVFLSLSGQTNMPLVNLSEPSSEAFHNQLVVGHGLRGTWETNYITIFYISSSFYCLFLRGWACGIYLAFLKYKSRRENPDKYLVDMEIFFWIFSLLSWIRQEVSIIIKDG